MPDDPLTECVSSAGNVWELETREQNITLLNWSAERQTVTLNGQGADLAPGGSRLLRCPALIPPEKAEWMSEAYLTEPEMVPADTSTPY